MYIQFIVIPILSYRLLLLKILLLIFRLVLYEEFNRNIIIIKRYDVDNNFVTRNFVCIIIQ